MERKFVDVPAENANSASSSGVKGSSVKPPSSHAMHKVMAVATSRLFCSFLFIWLLMVGLIHSACFAVLEDKELHGVEPADTLYGFNFIVVVAVAPSEIVELAGIEDIHNGILI